MRATPGRSSNAMASSAQRSERGERRRLVRPRAPGREDRGVDRLGEHRVRREEEHERHLVRDRAALDRCCRPRSRHRAAGRPSCSGTPPIPTAARRAVPPDRRTTQPRHEPERRCARRRPRGSPTNAATPRVPPSARISSSPAVSRQPGSGPATSRNTTIATTITTVSADRCDRRDGEPALRVEHGDRDGADRVEHHLRDEEPQQEGRQAPLLCRDLTGPRRPRSAGRAIQRRRDDRRSPTITPRRTQRDPQQPAGEPLHRAGSSPRSSRSTNVGTSTADSAPAARSSNSTFETEFDDEYVLPR